VVAEVHAALREHCFGPPIPERHEREAAVVVFFLKNRRRARHVVAKVHAGVDLVPLRREPHRVGPPTRRGSVPTMAMAFTITASWLAGTS